MKMKNSLTFRLVMSVFLAMGLANLITGGWYYVFAPAFGALRSPLQLLLVSLVLGTLLSIVFSKILMRPIYQLILATKKVAKGDFSVRVEPTRSKAMRVQQLTKGLWIVIRWSIVTQLKKAPLSLILNRLSCPRSS